MGLSILIKLAIFDLDGTLVNSLEDLADAVNYALKKNGFPQHETAKYKYFVGDGLAMLIKRVLPEEFRDEKTEAAIKSDFDFYYNEHYCDKTRPYDGIPELLRELRENGIKLAVASNKPDAFVKIIVKYFFKDMFDIILGKTDLLPKKPAPDIALKIMDELGVDKKFCVFAGDSNVDVLTAKNAGIISVGCLWGFRDFDELNQAGADYILSKPCEMLDVFNIKRRVD
jgi:phosphoglycolate phosphatase